MTGREFRQLADGLIAQASRPVLGHRAKAKPTGLRVRTRGEVFAGIRKAARAEHPDLSEAGAIAEYVQQHPETYEAHQGAPPTEVAPEASRPTGPSAALADMLEFRARQIAAAQGVSKLDAYSLVLASPEGRALAAAYERSRKR